jgi:hypothetical protein
MTFQEALQRANDRRRHESRVSVYLPCTDNRDHAAEFVVWHDGTIDVHGNLTVHDFISAEDWRVGNENK